MRSFRRSTHVLRKRRPEVRSAPGKRTGPMTSADLSAGVIIFAHRGALSSVPAAGGACSPLTTLNAASGETRHSVPSFLPDGRHFLYQRVSSRPENTGVYLAAAQKQNHMVRQSRQTRHTWPMGLQSAHSPECELILGQPLRIAGCETRTTEFQAAASGGVGCGFRAFPRRYGGTPAIPPR